MTTFQKQLAGIASMAILGGILGSTAVLRCSQPTAPQAQYSASYHDNEDGNRPLAFPCRLETSDIVALLTSFLAAWIALFVWSANRDQSRRQLRAYVFLECGV